MCVFLTGSNGQVGSETVKVFQDAGVIIKSFSRQQCDITDIDTLQSLISKEPPKAVINAAAYTAVDKAEDDAEAAYLINDEGSRNLATVCAKLDIPLIHISTDYVFDGHSTNPYKESDPTGPEGVYGKSKLDGELAISELCSKYIILRTSWVFGEHGNNFVKTMMKLAETRKELGIVNDQTGCPTSAKSIARALLVITKQVLADSDDWGTYHFCGTPQTTWYGFAARIFDELKRQGRNVPQINPITTAEYPLPARRPTYSVFNCDKINKVFSIKQSDWMADLVAVVNSQKSD